MTDAESRAAGDRRAAVIRGALWMAASAFLFIVTNATVHALSAHMDTAQIVFVRTLVIVLLGAPFLALIRHMDLSRPALRLHALRITLTLTGTYASFYAFGHMPLADATALQFTIPLFALLGAGLFLGERLGPVQIGATLAGFGGALLIVRPGFADVGWPAISMLFAAAVFAVEWLTVRVLRRYGDPIMIVLLANLGMLGPSLLAALPGWREIGWDLVPAIILIGIAGAGAFITQAKAFAAVEASIIVPLDFLRLPFAVAIGALFFGEVTGLWTWAGAAVIFAAGTIAVRGARR